MPTDKVKNYRSKNKAEMQRNPATDFRGIVSRVCGCLPSEFALDVHRGFKTGLLDENTSILAWEKEKTRRTKVARQLAKRTDNYDVIGKNIDNTDLSKWLNGKLMDLFLFDICGNFTAQLAKWFFDNQKCFESGMRMPMTLSANIRHKALHESVIKDSKGRYIDVVAKAMKNVVFSGEGMFGLTDAMKENIASQIYMVINSMPSKRIKFNAINVYRNSDKSTMAAYMVVLDTTVYNAKFDVRKFNTLKRVLKGYDKQVNEKSKLYFDRKRRKTSSKKKKIAFVDMFNIKSEKDLNKDKTIEAMFAYSDKHSIDFNHIVGGIRRSLTIRKAA
jgi:hypothetical protein